MAAGYVLRSRKTYYEMDEANTTEVKAGGERFTHQNVSQM